MRIAIITLLMTIFTAASAHAAVIVFDNRMREGVGFQLTAMKPTSPDAAGEASQWQPFGKPVSYEIASGDVLPIPVLGTVRINFGSSPPREYILDPNTVCFFAPFEGELDLQQIGFTHEQGFSATQSSDGFDVPLLSETALERQQKRWREIALKPSAVIPVKVLVDEDEVARPELWRKRLTDRIAAASKIFERSARIRFEVVAYGTWKSNNAVHDFQSSLHEFEREATPYPAQLAIGFTSQYKIPDGPTRLGGTFGPFRSHLLVREYHNHISETERLEVLVHELGHYFGATHSMEPDSVMRPKLGDRRSRSKEFRIKFDPLNTLILYLVGEEIRYHEIDQLSQVSHETKLNLRSVYTELARGFPEDDAAGRFLQFLYAPSDRTPKKGRPVDVRAGRVRRVVEAVNRALAAEIAGSSLRTRDREGSNAADAPAKKIRSGDELTEICLRAAAVEAGKLPKRHQVDAFLLGFGLAMDRPGHLRRNPLWLRNAPGFEQSDYELLPIPSRVPRPSIDDREDLLLHFAYSAALTALAGPSSAEMAGLVKELSDAKGASGFSFDDYAADLAGIELARRLKSLGSVPEEFGSQVQLSDIVPDFTGLPSGLDFETLKRDFGAPEDERFRDQRSKIVDCILALPAYRTDAFGLSESGERSP